MCEKIHFVRSSHDGGRLCTGLRIWTPKSLEVGMTEGPLCNIDDIRSSAAKRMHVQKKADDCQDACG
jgi:hypothetical protein